MSPKKRDGSGSNPCPAGCTCARHSTRGHPPRPVLERFWTKVDVRGPGDCWPWLSGKSQHGYGRFRVGGKTLYAHRVAYEFLVGPIPPDLQVDHLCRVRQCVNPEHMELVTGRENILRGEGWAAVNSRKTHCPEGHEYSTTNTGFKYTRHGAERVCLTCQRQRKAS